MKHNGRTGTTPLFLVFRARHVQWVALNDDTLQSVVEQAMQDQREPIGQFRVVDAEEYQQPLDVEIGLLDYLPGKSLYVREVRI